LANSAASTTRRTILSIGLECLLAEESAGWRVKQFESEPGEVVCAGAGEVLGMFVGEGVQQGFEPVKLQWAAQCAGAAATEPGSRVWHIGHTSIQVT
jgi:hypothetical protein